MSEGKKKEAEKQRQKKDIWKSWPSRRLLSEKTTLSVKKSSILILKEILMTKKTEGGGGEP